ncbi:MAG TPA: peptidylprolyl isomerase [Gemmatimonadaceae bacterium]|nr:peptidylprolyl isomerase [Gemmatimonadaceae bacterium]
MLQAFRGSAKVVFWIVFVSFVGVFLFAETSGLSSRGVTRGTSVGSVNGVDITYDRWDAQVRALTQQEQQRRGVPSLTQDDVSRIEEIAFQQIVDSILLAREYDRRGITVTDREIQYAARTMPHPDLAQNPDLQTEGRFDPEKYQRLLQSPMARQQGLTQFLEQYYRTEIPRQKLFEQIAAGVYLTDARLWRIWQDERDSARVSYVALRPGSVPDSAVRVTDDEIRRYFDAHRDDFGDRRGRAVLSLISLPRPITAADTAASRQRALDVRAEIAGGVPFDTVARRESSDSVSAANGGLLGTVTRGAFVPEFERAAFALRPGELSQPVLSPFGFHIIKVDSRKGDSITVRHVLVPVRQSDSSEQRVTEQADTIANIVTSGDDSARFERAAQRYQLPIARVVAAEGDPLTWNGKYVPDLGAWAFRGSRVGDISDIVDSPDAFYVARIDSLEEGGDVALDDVRDDIRRVLMNRKKVDYLEPRARRITDAVVAGKTLEQAAQENGLSVERTLMFTRVSLVQGLGRLNEAVGAAFGLPVGAISAPIKTEDGVFVIRVDARVNADRAAWEAQKQTQREQLLLRLRRQRIQDFVTALRKEADVDDRRREVQALTRNAAS